MLDRTSIAKKFSPVEEFYVATSLSSSGIISGYAAPSRGPRCCIVAIVSGERVLAMSRASNFSDDAQEKNIRLGWSGFRISGLAHALATGADPQLQCLVSGLILRQWSCVELLEILRTEPSLWTDVQGIRTRLQLEQGCSNVQQIIDFALDLRAKQGPEAFLNASYRYFLHRNVDNAGKMQFMQAFSDSTSILRFWREIILSDEFVLRKRGALSGPFEAGFPFSLHALDLPRKRSYEKVGDFEPGFNVL